MTSNSLRSRVIRLAASKPQLRAYLLPMLTPKQATPVKLSPAETAVWEALSDPAVARGSDADVAARLGLDFQAWQKAREKFRNDCTSAKNLAYYQQKAQQMGLARGGETVEELKKWVGENAKDYDSWIARHNDTMAFYAECAKEVDSSGIDQEFLKGTPFPTAAKMWSTIKKVRKLHHLHHYDPVKVEHAVTELRLLGPAAKFLAATMKKYPASFQDFTPGAILSRPSPGENKWKVRLPGILADLILVDDDARYWKVALSWVAQQTGIKLKDMDPDQGPWTFEMDGNNRDLELVYER